MKKYVELNRNNLRTIEFLNKEIEELRATYPTTPIFNNETGHRKLYKDLSQAEKNQMDTTIEKQYQVSFELKLLIAEKMMSETSFECEAISEAESHTVVVFFPDILKAYDITSNEWDIEAFNLVDYQDWQEYVETFTDKCHYVKFTYSAEL